MLHNRYYEEYESDFQYYLRREMNNNTQPKYKSVYITPNGEWHYAEPDGDYILIHVDIRCTPSNIDAIAASYMNQFTYPF